MCIKRLLSIISLCMLMGLLVGCHEAPSSGGNPPIGESESSIELAPNSSNTLTLTNNLNVLTNFTITTSGSLSGLSITPTTCSNVSPGGSCSVTLTTNSTPSGSGNIIVTNGLGDTLSTPIILDTPSVSYGGTTISAVGNNTVTITNTSGITVTFTSLSLALSSPSSPEAASGLTLLSTTCDESLASGASCTATISAVTASYGTATLSFTGGNLDGESTTLTVAQPAVEFQNQAGTALANIHVDSDATTDAIYVKNTGAFDVQNLLLSIGGTTTGVTKATDTCSGNSLEPGDLTRCTFTLHADNPSSATGATITASATNLSSTNISLTTGDLVTVAEVDQDAQNSDEINARGLSTVELELQNNLGAGKSITDITLTSSDTDSVNVLSDANHPNACTAATLTNGQSCTFWIRATSGTTLGNVNSNLNVGYTQGGIPSTEEIPLTATTRLYAAGRFSLATGIPCLDADGEALGNNADCDNLARFDGTNWSQVADSKLSGSNSTILRDMILANDRLYIAGNFSSLDVSPNATPDNANYLASWDGYVAGSVGTSSAPFTAPLPAVFDSPYNSTYSNVNMLAYDATNNRLFFNRIVATSTTAEIYSSELNNTPNTWTAIAYAGSASGTTSSNMLYNTDTSILYVTGPSNRISGNGLAPAASQLIWYWNGTSWAGFTPIGVSANDITLSSFFINGNTLYDYYGTNAANFLCTSSGDITTPNCGGVVPPSIGGTQLYHAGLTGFNPGNDSLVVVGSVMANPAPAAAIRTITTPAENITTTTGSQIQLIFNAVNVGTSQYIGGTFNSFNGTGNLACVAQIVDGGTVSAITGLAPAACDDASLMTPPNNQDVIYKLLVVPSVTLGS